MAETAEAESIRVLQLLEDAGAMLYCTATDTNSQHKCGLDNDICRTSLEDAFRVSNSET